MTGQDFVIIPETAEESDPFVISFIADELGAGAPGNYFIGSLIGNPYADKQFAKRLQRVRARLDIKNMSYYNVWGRLDVQPIKRLSDVEKYKRKRTKVINEYNRRVELAKSSLFGNSIIDELKGQLTEALAALKLQYNINDI